MPNHRNSQDKYLRNGSIIYWSRRQDPNVPVKCGVCGRERLIELNNTTRRDFSGLCRQCSNNEAWEDVTLQNGSVVYWSRRNGQHVPVKCGKCGKEHMAHGVNIRKDVFTGFCRSCLHTGPTSTTWRGGRVEKGGYIQVKVYPDHPFFSEMASSTGYIPEHRLIMAQHLGRPLKSTEIVHHKNGIKTDNRIQNLELFESFSEHGKALQERIPHPGFLPVSKLRRILQKAKELIEAEDRKKH